MPAKPFTVLFVCSGNTCRSPMAQGLLRRMLGPGQEIRVWSAGLSAVAGQPASDNALQAMREESVDLSGHRSLPLTLEMVRQADLVLTMSVHHKQAVLEMAPEFHDRIFTLREFAEEAQEQSEQVEKQPGELRQRRLPGLDIMDPFGQSLAVYRRTAQEIKELLERALPRIRQLAAGESRQGAPPRVESRSTKEPDGPAPPQQGTR